MSCIPRQPGRVWARALLSLRLRNVQIFPLHRFLDSSGGRFPPGLATDFRSTALVERSRGCLGYHLKACGAQLALPVPASKCIQLLSNFEEFQAPYQGIILQEEVFIPCKTVRAESTEGFSADRTLPQLATAEGSHCCGN